MAARILLVEDNEMNRDMLRRRLVKRGYEVLVALDGQQGIKVATSEMPELIIMDLSLPGVDGWEATQRLKTDYSTRSIPIIALSAHAMLSDRERALAAGCDDYHTKPGEFIELLDKIESLLQRARR